MCILFVAVNQHKDYPLIIAANRDEFFSRKTAKSHFWSEHPHVLAGRDIQAGGSWMGINQQGYLASLTNIRAPHTIKNDVSSRGELVSQFLQNPSKIKLYQQTLAATKEQYNGYNLLFGKWNELAVYNNHNNKLDYLSNGFYGLSNADLNSPWPKINKGVNKLEQHCQNNQVIIAEELFELLLDTSKAPDAELPTTGAPIEWERRLSSIFIQGQEYGTRSSTVLTVDKNQKVSWQERTYNNQAKCTSDQKFQFSII
jgi:uncharacterized protein with NRDE domain